MLLLKIDETNKINKYQCKKKKIFPQKKKGANFKTQWETKK